MRNQATRDTGALYVSQMLAAALGFAVALIVARELGPREFAVITAYVLLIDVLAGFTDFGLGTGLIKFTSPLLRSDRRAAFPYFRAALYAEIAAGILVLVLGLSFSGLLSRLIGSDLPDDAVVLAIVAAAVTSTGAYVSAAQSAHKMFMRNAILTGSVSVVRFAAVLALLLTSSLSLYSVLYAYATVSVIGAAAGFLVTPRDYLEPAVPGAVRRAAGEIFRFSGWLTLTFFLTSVMGRLDFFYLYRLRGADAAGVYAAAVQLSLGVTILIGAITTVLTPHASERVTYASKIDFLKRSMPVVGAVGLLLVASSLTFPFVIDVLFGEQYAAAADPLAVLVVHLALNVVLIPVTLLFIPYGRVRVGTFISVLQLGLALWLLPILIDRHGPVGASLMVLINTALACVIYAVILRRYLLRERDAERYAAA